MEGQARSDYSSPVPWCRPHPGQIEQLLHSALTVGAAAPPAAWRKRSQSGDRAVLSGPEPLGGPHDCPGCIGVFRLWPDSESVMGWLVIRLSCLEEL